MDIRPENCLTSLLLLESSAGSLPAAAGAAALDIHMVCSTLVVAVIHALHRLAVDADMLAGMGDGACERVKSLPVLREALAAGIIAAAGVFPAHTDIALAAKVFCVIYAIINTAF